MRRLFGAVLLALSLASAARAETFDNASVIALTRAGLGSEVILAKIAALPCGYDVSTSGLLALRDGGVAQAVVAALVRRCSGSGQDAGAAESANRPAAGIYLFAPSSAHDLILLRPAATMGIKRTGNGSLLFPRRATLTVARAHAQVSTTEPRPIFYFYFDPADDKVNTFGTAVSEAAQSPNEFALVRFRIDRDTRQLAIGREEVLLNVEGIDPKIALPFAIEPLGAGGYRITFPADLAAGEYGFVLIGEGLRGRIYYRTFDFAVVARE